MTKPDPQIKWPDYLPLPRQDILAIGVIALNYCQLENMLKALFSSVTRLNHYQTAALFHRLANNVRKDILLELLAKTTIPAELREHIEYFQKGFSICADNRHQIMHSSSGGIHDSNHGRGLVLKRYSRAGSEFECFLTFDDLRRVADETHAYIAYGAWLTGDATTYAHQLNRGEEKSFQISPATLQGKPPPPTPLNWRSAAAPTAPHSQLFAFDLISPYRVRKHPDDLG